ncbi:hypothetical protein BH09ACT6_BH09ACT6_09040 [soil metagenome]
MGEIAERAEMGLSAAYYHFSSTDELLEAVINEIFGAAAERFRVAPGENSLSEWARGCAMRHTAWMRVEPREARLLLALSEASPGGPRALESFRTRIEAVTVEIAQSIRQLDSAKTAVEAHIVARGMLSLVAESAGMAVNSNGGLVDEFDTVVAATGILMERLAGASAAG